MFHLPVGFLAQRAVISTAAIVPGSGSGNGRFLLHAALRYKMQSSLIFRQAELASEEESLLLVTA